MLGSSYVNDFNRFGRVYKVYMQAEPEFRKDPKQIGLFFVKNAQGGMVPLDTLVSTRPTQGPEFTNRFNLFRSAELTGVPAAGVSSTQALDALEATAREVLPPDMSFDWADMSYQERRAPGVAVVFALAIFLVFLILAAQYESWGLPFSVLLGTPFAVFGAYLGLYLARTFMGPSYVNNVFAQIGLIMLIGLAAKNAILIVEFAKMEFDKGTPLVEAALLAAKLRFRPILMTAFAFILGVVPLLTAAGAGAEGRKVMGMAVFAGMLVATFLGVLLIPMLYVVVMKVTGGSKPASRQPEAHHRHWPPSTDREGTEMIRPSLRALAATLTVSAALAGCTVGPDYERPQVVSPDQFRFVDGPAAGADAGRRAVVRDLQGRRAPGAHQGRAGQQSRPQGGAGQGRRGPRPRGDREVVLLSAGRRAGQLHLARRLERQRRPPRRSPRTSTTASTCRGKSTCSGSCGASANRRSPSRSRPSRTGVACWSR